MMFAVTNTLSAIHNYITFVLKKTRVICSTVHTKAKQKAVENEFAFSTAFFKPF